MLWLPNGEKVGLHLAVSVEYHRRVTDRRTSCDSIVRAMHNIAR